MDTQSEIQSSDFIKMTIRRVMQLLEENKVQEAIDLLKEVLKVLE